MGLYNAARDDLLLLTSRADHMQEKNSQARGECRQGRLEAETTEVQVDEGQQTK